MTPSLATNAVHTFIHVLKDWIINDRLQKQNLQQRLNKEAKELIL